MPTETLMKGEDTMADKNKKTAKASDKRSGAKVKKSRTKKQKLIRVAVIVAIVIGVLLLLSEVVLPALSRMVGKESSSDEGDFLFGDGELSAYDAQLWQTMNRDIVYGSYDSVGKTSSVLTHTTVDGGDFDTFAPFWLSYIDSIKNGDEKKYASHYASNCVFDGVSDPYAAGNEEFEEQRIYDIEIFRMANDSSPESAGSERFEVTYKIFRNPGTFRKDINDWDKTAPYIITLEKAASGNYVITRVEYKYKP